MYEEIKNHIKGIATIEITNEAGEIIANSTHKNTLTNEFIWDLLRQQMFRTNAQKRKMTPLNGITLTYTDVPKSAEYPSMMGEVAGHASLFGNSDNSVYNVGYPDSVDTKCQDGEFIFTFIWGPDKVLNDFNTIWLHDGNYTREGITVLNAPEQNSIVGQGIDGHTYALSRNTIICYKIVAKESSYEFVEESRTVLTQEFGTAGTFNALTNNFYVVYDTDPLTIDKIDLSGNVLKRASFPSISSYVVSLTCMAGTIYAMANGILYAMSDDLALLGEVVTNVEFKEFSQIFSDGITMLYVQDYDVTSKASHGIDVFNVLGAQSQYLYTIPDLIESQPQTIYPLFSLGRNYFYMNGWASIVNMCSIPCTMNTLDDVYGNRLTYNKPKGYSAKIVYKIFFDFNDVESLENQKINPRAFQDMIFNMLLPDDEYTEGINTFGCMMLCDGDILKKTTARTPKIGFANKYSYEINESLAGVQGRANYTADFINRPSSKIQHKFEFDYVTANGHMTHVQTGTNSPIITGFNNPDGRCYMPKIIAKARMIKPDGSEFNNDEYNAMFNEFSHKVCFAKSSDGTAKAYILNRSAKNTLKEIVFNLFDNEYIVCTLKNDKIITLNEINLNDETALEIVYIGTSRQFYVITLEKIYKYDEQFNFIEHIPNPLTIEVSEYMNAHGGMQSVYTRKLHTVFQCYDILNKTLKWEHNISCPGMLINKVNSWGCDDEFLYVNVEGRINSIDASFFLVYKITESGLELETYNQSRRVDGSIIHTNDLFMKHMFIETRYSESTYEMNPEDISEDYYSSGFYLAHSMPYITAVNRLQNEVTKTSQYFLQGVFETKLK